MKLPEHSRTSLALKLLCIFETRVAAAALANRAGRHGLDIGFVGATHQVAASIAGQPLVDHLEFTYRGASNSKPTSPDGFVMVFLEIGHQIGWFSIMFPLFHSNWGIPENSRWSRSPREESSR